VIEELKRERDAQASAAEQRLAMLEGMRNVTARSDEPPEGWR